jgi:hypothetical protein
VVHQVDRRYHQENVPCIIEIYPVDGAIYASEQAILYRSFEIYRDLYTNSSVRDRAAALLIDTVVNPTCLTLIDLLDLSFAIYEYYNISTSVLSQVVVQLKDTRT